MRVDSGGIVVSAGRDQHAHEICGDPGMVRGAAERLAEIGLGRVVVRIERGGDGDTVGDPGRQRQVPANFLRLPEVLPGRFDPVPRKLRATGAEERFRPYRSCVTGQGRGFGEITHRADIVVGAEGDIAEPQERFRGVLEALGKGCVLPASHLRLAGGERGRRDRQVVPQKISAVNRIPWRGSSCTTGE